MPLATVTGRSYSFKREKWTEYETCTIGEAKRFLSSPEVMAKVNDKPAKINQGLTMHQVHVILSSFGDDPDEKLLHSLVFKNMMREFGR